MNSYLMSLPLAVYGTDPKGWITFYNEPAALLWGRRPELEAEQWCGFSHLFHRDGRPMRHDQCPMAMALANSELETEIIAERADGKRLCVEAHPNIVRDEDGKPIGAVNLLIDVTDRQSADAADSRLAAIVASSNDAIIGKTLDGTITSWNDAATRIFGYQPNEIIGQTIRKIIPAELQGEEDSILARLRKGEHLQHFETVRVAKDGHLVNLSVAISPIRDFRGVLVGASKVARDVTEQKRAQVVSARLAAIVDSSDDAIISKDLDGTIISWNGSAERIFGYSAEEMIGQSIKRLIPSELQQEEDGILDKLRRGERVDHFDTVRVTKNGSPIDVSLTISPIRDVGGCIIGASKIARDISERKQNEMLQRLLFDELNHRVKNTLATIQSIANQSMRTASSPREFAESFNGRLQALAVSHDLLVQQRMSGASIVDLIQRQVTLGTDHGSHIDIDGPSVMLDPRSTAQLGLVLHELATNARKYGALSVPTGRLSVEWRVEVGTEPELRIQWRESGVPWLQPPEKAGFGMQIIEHSLQSARGEAKIQYGVDGIVCDMRLSLPPDFTIAPPSSELDRPENVLLQTRPDTSRQRRILVVEDEPLIAMEIEAELEAAGFQLVGPAYHIESAKQAIAEEKYDAVLLDANLGGHRVDELAESLEEKGVPFVFVTGYGREALPAKFQTARLITKPFHTGHIASVLQAVFEEKSQKNQRGNFPDTFSR